MIWRADALPMGAFAYLLAGHLVGDFLFQTGWMARHKAHRWLPLLVHCLVYTVVVAASALPAGGLAPVGLGLIFVSHVFLDGSRFVRWWVKHIMTAPTDGWLTIVADQTFHVVVLVVAAAL